MNRFRNERGQAFVLMTLGLVVMLAMSAFAIDVGSWYRTDRRLQGTADAAALAGAQMLPDSPSGAKSLAMEYAGKNGGDVAGGDIKVEKTFNPNDTISVKAAKADPGFFSKVLGVDTVNISASAKARADSPKSVRYMAPMVVHCNHPLIRNCDGSHEPDFLAGTSMDYDPMGAPGAFGMLNLSEKGGTPGTSEQADWILKGFDKWCDIGLYASNPGAKFSSAEIQGALDARIGTELLFPVFKTLGGTGSNAQYDIIGFIGFHLTSYVVHGNTAALSGYFTEYIAHGILASSGSGIPPSFGVKSIQLID